MKAIEALKLEKEKLRYLKTIPYPNRHDKKKIMNCEMWIDLLTKLIEWRSDYDVKSYKSER